MCKTQVVNLMNIGPSRTIVVIFMRGDELVRIMMEVAKNPKLRYITTKLQDVTFQTTGKTSKSLS